MMMLAANDNEPQTKRCNACKVVKPVSEFNKRTDRPSGIRPECRECQKLRTRRWKESEAGQRRMAEYANDNEAQERRREYLSDPKTKAAAAARHKRWRDTPAGRVKLAIIIKRSQSKPSAKARRSRHRMARYRTDPIYAAQVAIRSMLSRVLRATQEKKNNTTVATLGYTAEQFKQRIECQFLPGMSWDNRRHDTWHIDHKKPIAAFIAQGITNPRTINALSNLQPVWATDNMTKGAVWREVDFRRAASVAA